MNWPLLERYLLFMFANFGWLYIMCDVGDDVTTCFGHISDAIYDCPWHKLPVNLRKYFPSMILIAQKPIYIQGMGNIRCTRETFKVVIIIFL